MLISKTMREELPDTIDGLKVFIKEAEKEEGKISRKIEAARILLVEKERGRRL